MFLRACLILLFVSVLQSCDSKPSLSRPSEPIAPTMQSFSCRASLIAASRPEVNASAAFVAGATQKEVESLLQLLRQWPKELCGAKVSHSTTKKIQEVLRRIAIRTQRADFSLLGDKTRYEKAVQLYSRAFMQECVVRRAVDWISIDDNTFAREFRGIARGRCQIIGNENKFAFSNHQLQISLPDIGGPTLGTSLRVQPRSFNSFGRRMLAASSTGSGLSAALSPAGIRNFNQCVIDASKASRNCGPLADDGGTEDKVTCPDGTTAPTDADCPPPEDSVSCPDGSTAPTDAQCPDDDSTPSTDSAANNDESGTADEAAKNTSDTNNTMWENYFEHKTPTGVKIYKDYCDANPKSRLCPDDGDNDRCATYRFGNYYAYVQSTSTFGFNPGPVTGDQMMTKCFCDAGLIDGDQCPPTKEEQRMDCAINPLGPDDGPRPECAEFVRETLVITGTKICPLVSCPVLTVLTEGEDGTEKCDCLAAGELPPIRGDDSCAAINCGPNLFCVPPGQCVNFATSENGFAQPGSSPAPVR